MVLRERDARALAVRALNNYMVIGKCSLEHITPTLFPRLYGWEKKVGGTLFLPICTVGKNSKGGGGGGYFFSHLYGGEKEWGAYSFSQSVNEWGYALSHLMVLL